MCVCVCVHAFCMCVSVSVCNTPSTHQSLCAQSKALLVLLSLGQFHKVVEMLYSMRCFDRAACFIEACMQFEALAKTEETSKYRPVVNSTVNSTQFGLVGHATQNPVHHVVFFSVDYCSFTLLEAVINRGI